MLCQMPLVLGFPGESLYISWWNPSSIGSTREPSRKVLSGSVTKIGMTLEHISNNQIHSGPQFLHITDSLWCVSIPWMAMCVSHGE